MKYHAFISYSHADRRWGDWLHKALETFIVPKGLVGTAGRFGTPIPARAFPVFRDRDELPTSAELGPTIDAALRESRVLVVICSPRAAKSRWVNEEILSFKRLGMEDRVLALIVDGIPNGEDHGDADRECFPPALRHPILPTGDLDLTRRVEPIAADARPDGDGKANALLKVLSGVLGVSYDALKRRDERRRTVRRRMALAGATALILLFAGLAAVATAERRTAERARDRATESRQQAENLITFLSIDLVEKLTKAGRLDIQKDVTTAVESYYRQRDWLMARSGDQWTVDELRLYGIGLMGRANLARDMGQDGEAEQLYRRASDTFTRVLGRDSSQWSASIGLIMAQQELARVLMNRGKLEDAAQMLVQIVPVGERHLMPRKVSGRSLGVDLREDGELREGGIVTLSPRDTLGLLVQRVLPGSPAQQAGLQVGDRLQMLNGISLRTSPGAEFAESDSAPSQIFLRTLDKIPVNGRADLTFIRNGEVHRVTAVPVSEAQLDVRRPSAMLMHANTYHQMGVLENARDSLVQAEANFRIAAQLLDEAFMLDSSDVDIAHLRGVVKRGMALNFGRAEQGDSAIRYMMEAVRMGMRLMVADSTNMLWKASAVEYLLELGNLMGAITNVPEAASLEEFALREATKVGEALVAHDPVNANWRQNLGLGYQRLAVALRKQGRFGEAAQYAKRSQSIADALGRPLPPM